MLVNQIRKFVHHIRSFLRCPLGPFSVECSAGSCNCFINISSRGDLDVRFNQRFIVWVVNGQCFARSSVNKLDGNISIRNLRHTGRLPYLVVDKQLFVNHDRRQVLRLVRVFLEFVDENGGPRCRCTREERPLYPSRIDARLDGAKRYNASCLCLEYASTNTIGSTDADQGSKTTQSACPAYRPAYVKRIQQLGRLIPSKVTDGLFWSNSASIEHNLHDQLGAQTTASV